MLERKEEFAQTQLLSGSPHTIFVPFAPTLRHARHGDACRDVRGRAATAPLVWSFVQSVAVVSCSRRRAAANNRFITSHPNRRLRRRRGRDGRRRRRCSCSITRQLRHGEAPRRRTRPRANSVLLVRLFRTTPSTRRFGRCRCRCRGRDCRRPRDKRRTRRKSERAHVADWGNGAHCRHRDRERNLFLTRGRCQGDGQCRIRSARLGGSWLAILGGHVLRAHPSETGTLTSPTQADPVSQNWE
jgi:hypothetical protein